MENVIQDKAKKPLKLGVSHYPALKLIVLFVVSLCSCSNPHQSPESVATAFQKAIHRSDYKAAINLLSDTCKALVQGTGD